MYRTSVVAAALGVDVRSVDALVRTVRGKHLPFGARGRARQLPDDLVALFAVSLLIRRDFGCPLTRATQLAESLLTAENSSIQVGSVFRLQIDRHRLQDVIKQALADAVADVVPPRRGRPPRKAGRGAL